jgi:hypothetical protein
LNQFPIALKMLLRDRRTDAASEAAPGTSTLSSAFAGSAVAKERKGRTRQSNIDLFEENPIAVNSPF